MAIRSLPRLLLAAAAASTPAAFAADADHDPRFAANGVGVYDLSTAADRFDELHAFAPHPAGGYVALAGRTYALNDTALFVLRLDDAGAIVGTSPQIDVPTSYVQAATIDREGRVLFAAVQFLAADGRGIRLERRLADGAPDPTFDGDGQRVLEEAGGRIDASSIAVDAQGRITVAGNYVPTGGTVGVDSETFVARMEAGGTPIAAFGGDGQSVVVVAQFATESTRAIAHALGNQVLLCGWAQFSGSTDAVVTRLETDGTIDADFGSSGTAIYDSASPTEDWTDFCDDLGVQPATGRLYMLVHRRLGGPIKGGVRAVALTSDGDFTVIDQDAMTSTSYPGNARLAFDAESRLLIAASMTDATAETDVRIARLAASGLAKDATFGVGGERIFPVVAGAVRREPDHVAAVFADRGRIVFAATHGDANTDALWAVQRLQGSLIHRDGFE